MSVVFCCVARSHVHTAPETALEVGNRNLSERRPVPGKSLSRLGSLDPCHSIVLYS